MAQLKFIMPSLNGNNSDLPQIVAQTRRVIFTRYARQLTHLLTVRADVDGKLTPTESVIDLLEEFLQLCLDHKDIVNSRPSLREIILGRIEQFSQAILERHLRYEGRIDFEELRTAFTAS